MGNNVNFCGIVAFSEDISVCNMSRNINLQHYNAPAIFSNPDFRFHNFSINMDDFSALHPIVCKETEIEGERVNSELMKKQYNGHILDNDLNLSKTVGSALFSKKESYEKII